MSARTYAPRNATVRAATEKQVVFLSKLAAERGVEFDAAAPLTSTAASREIDRLLAMPRKVTARKPAAPVAVDVPAGHYAVPSRTGANDLDFWRVDRPAEGRWAGYVFVKRVLGGHDPVSVRGAEATAALAAISAAGPLAAAAVYGQQIGQCSHCHRELTDVVSRFTGYGPTCRGHGALAVTAETRAAAAAWAAANGHADLLAG